MDSFQDIELQKELQKALSDLNFEKPTEIQAASIPSGLKGRDIIACAQTGSGKTAAFLIPALSRLLDNPKKNALILAPTRELAQQIADFNRQLTKHCKKMGQALLVGGADYRKQMRMLNKKPRVVIATPGRLIDHLERKSLDLSHTEVLVLDEGDRMLDMGFAPQLDEILKYLPKKRQTSMYTATLPKKVQILADKYLFQPVRVTAGPVSQPVETIAQSVLQLSHKEKDDKILDELNARSGSVIIFTRTKIRTDKLAKHLKDYGFQTDSIHGGRTQGQRNKAIQNFKSGKCRILVATDVAARGIDVPAVEHVINFDLPMMSEDYVHRIGRTARNGASGNALSFVTPEDHRAWLILARKYKIEGCELKGVIKAQKSQGKKKSSGRRFSRSQNNKDVTRRDNKDFTGRGSKKKAKSYRVKAADGSVVGKGPKKKSKSSRKASPSAGGRPFKKRSKTSSKRTHR